MERQPGDYVKVVAALLGLGLTLATEHRGWRRVFSPTALCWQLLPTSQRRKPKPRILAMASWPRVVQPSRSLRCSDSRFSVARHPGVCDSFHLDFWKQWRKKLAVSLCNTCYIFINRIGMQLKANRPGKYFASNLIAKGLSFVTNVSNDAWPCWYMDKGHEWTLEYAS